MKHFLLTFLILQSIFSFAQREKLILTKNDNDLWFKSLNANEKLSKKIDLINRRLTDDLNVYIEWSFADGITVQRIPKLDSIRKIRPKGFCKPLYIVKYKTKQIAFRIENPLNTKLTSSVSELINENNIYDVEVWTDDERQILYGTSANCGIVFISTDKRKIFKEFKKLELPSYYLDEILNY